MKNQTLFLIGLLSMISLLSITCKKDSESVKIFSKANLTADYEFNGGVTDNSGNANTGIVHGATLTVGRNNEPNAAYYFDGYTSYIELPATVALNTDDNFSIEAWINNKDITSDSRYSDNAIYGQSDGFQGSDYPVIAFEVKPDNKLRGAIRGTTNPPLNALSEGLIQNEEWYHVVLVRNAGLNSLQTYVNGNLAASDTLAIIGNTSSNDFVAIGAYADDLQAVFHYFHGSIDMVRIWKVALTEEEIASLNEGKYRIE